MPHHCSFNFFRNSKILENSNKIHATCPQVVPHFPTTNTGWQHLQKRGTLLDNTNLIHSDASAEFKQDGNGGGNTSPQPNRYVQHSTVAHIRKEAAKYC